MEEGGRGRERGEIDFSGEKERKLVFWRGDVLRRTSRLKEINFSGRGFAVRVSGKKVLVVKHS